MTFLHQLKTSYVYLFGYCTPLFYYLGVVLPSFASPFQHIFINFNGINEWAKPCFCF